MAPRNTTHESFISGKRLRRLSGPRREQLLAAIGEARQRTPIARRGRGPGRKPAKQLITLRLSAEALATFRATGDGWQTRIGEAVEAAARMVKYGA